MGRSRSDINLDSHITLSLSNHLNRSPKTIYKSPATNTKAITPTPCPQTLIPSDLAVDEAAALEEDELPLEVVEVPDPDPVEVALEELEVLPVSVLADEDAELLLVASFEDTLALVVTVAVAVVATEALEVKVDVDVEVAGAVLPVPVGAESWFCG